MPRPPSAHGGARRERCPRCGAPTLRQLVGARAALDVTTDARELTPTGAQALREPDRLDWCLRTTRGGPDLRWADCRRRLEPCTHPHVIDHRCPPGTATPATPVQLAF